MKQKPLITIGITCFNAEDTIERALISAFDQDYPNTEIVIVDDCSSDDSIALIEKLIEGRKNAKLIKHKINGGVAVARNTIIENSNGEYIAFFDDDDYSYPTRLTKQKKSHRRIPRKSWRRSLNRMFVRRRGV